MYQPREDSFLIQKHIKGCIKPNSAVLDVGTGSGILAREAAKHCKNVTACDIDKELIAKLSKENRHIKFVSSNLFLNIEGKFDLIIFNPPYLPSKKIENKEIDGGKNGTQLIEKFLQQAKHHLKPEGKILLVCSSLNRNIEKLFEKYHYNFKLIDKQAFFFEQLFLYMLF